METLFSRRTFISPFLLFMFFIFSTFSAVVIGVKNPQYSDYCNDVVSESLPPFTLITDPSKPSLSKASFKYSSDHSEFADSGRTLSLRTDEIYRTRSDSVFKLDGALFIRNIRFPGHSSNSTRRGLRLVHFRPPRIPVNGYYRSDFSLSGFWNSSSGKLCLVGKGNQRLGSAYGVLKLDYPNESSIFTSLVNGSLEIFNEDGKLLDYLHILGVSSRNYEYKLIEEVSTNNAFGVFDNLTEVSLGIDSRKQVCQVFRNQGFHELKYMTDCESENCDFLGGGRMNATLPRGIYMHQIACSDSGFVRYLLGSKQLLDPGSALIAEGKWNDEKKRLEIVGCRISDVEGTVSDCSIRLILRQSSVYTIQQRSSVVGEIWSNKSLNEAGYFGNIALHGVGDRPLNFNSVRYEYTQLEKMRRSCSDKMVSKRKGERYPQGTSQDMMFNMVLRNRKGDEVFGTSSPFSVGDALVEPFSRQDDDSSNHGKPGENGLVNVSFDMDFAPLLDLNLSGDLPQFSRINILTEGIYDSKNGHLCMVGCMRIVLPPYVTYGRITPPDCEVLVDLQYPPVNAKHKTMIEGTIETTRNKSDPRYFEPLDIVSRSLYTNQVRESLWRMDLEIIMVLVSNSLACIVVGLQLFYVKKHPDMVLFISVAMLTVLTLGHLIPLLLNFEALFFSNHNKQNVYLGSDGWLEVNEVLVRVITMVAFLLEFRLLQLTWSAKNNAETQKNIWVSEKNVLYLCLPLYIAGALIAWLSHLSSKSHGRSLLLMPRKVHKEFIFWKDLKCYAGLILDGFLFPQILFNFFHDSKEKALAPIFFIGTTIIRLLPHAYDLYRAHVSPIMPVHYIYANPNMDYYSTSWDISICIVGLLFAVLVCLQQRFGGRFFVHKKFRENISYEKVSVVSTGN